MVVGFLRSSSADVTAWLRICLVSAFVFFGLNLDFAMEISMVLHVELQCVVQLAALRELVDR